MALLVTFTLAILVVPLAAEAQQATNVYWIGWLSPGFPRPDHDPPVDAFRQGLREFGYVEGQNFVIEYRGLVGGCIPRRSLLPHERAPQSGAITGDTPGRDQPSGEDVPLRPHSAPFLRGSLRRDGLVLGELIVAAIPFPLAVQPLDGCHRLGAHVGDDELVSRLEGRRWRVGVVRPIPCPVEHPPDIHHDVHRFHGLHDEDFMRL
jgi:hypothetical protein